MSDDRSRPRPLEEVSGTDLGDEYIFYDDQGDQVHVLNGTAREIYLQCDGNRTRQEIAASLCEKYEVDQATAESDVTEVINQLVELKLLTLS